METQARALDEDDVLTIYELLKNGVAVGVIAKKYNVNHSNISAIKAGKSWKHIYHHYSEGSETRSSTSYTVSD